MMPDREGFSALLRQMADDLDAGNFSAIVVVTAGVDADPGLTMISYGDGSKAGEMLTAALSGRSHNGE